MCSTLVCTCRKNCLKCVASCSECRGWDCKNSYIIMPTDLLDNEEPGNNIYIEITLLALLFVCFEYAKAENCHFSLHLYQNICTLPYCHYWPSNIYIYANLTTKFQKIEKLNSLLDSTS